MFDVKVILHSKGPNGRELKTITSTFPRIILAEVNTHRDRARNAASSRAIPFMAMSESIMADPFIPIVWPGEQSGMQGAGPIPLAMGKFAQEIWLETLEYVNKQAHRLHNIGQSYLDAGKTRMCAEDEQVKIHKSIPNRLIEPWMWCTQVMSATEWENFFRLRCHPDAEPHFQKIAEMIRTALAASEPQILKAGEWHLPFVTGYDLPSLIAEGYTIEQIKKISVSRCARVSYLTHEGTRHPAKDLDLFERLVQGSGFGHWSAHEHVAMAMDVVINRSGPYIGFKQFRKEFDNECADKT